MIAHAVVAIIAFPKSKGPCVLICDILTSYILPVCTLHVEGGLFRIESARSAAGRVLNIVGCGYISA